MKNLNPWILAVTIGGIGTGMLFYAYYEPGVFDRRSSSDKVGESVSGNFRNKTSVFSYFQTPQAMPELRFMNRKNREITLEAFQGSFVLLNIWATWCAPCREEMPALDRLQEKLGGSDFHVLALSIDEAPPSVIERFYNSLEINSLFVYHDPTGKASFKLKSPGIPTTYLIDRSGKGIGYVVGPVEWDSPEVAREIVSYLSSGEENN
jgi:thiol-disulfide isomerase/thioredoxin